MIELENSILNMVDRKKFFFYIIVFSSLGFLIRYVGRDWISYDMEVCLIPWYEQIKNQGALASLDKQVGNYNVAYQTIIAILTYIPVKNLYGYKIISGIFDYLLAAVGYAIVKKLDNNRWHALAAYSILLFLPTTFINSAYWGQCDSIYSFWCLLSLLLIISNKYKSAFFIYGIALSFKLQSIFLLPLLAFIYIYYRRFSLANFLMAPLGFFVTAIPAIIDGKSPISLLQVYREQTTLHQQLYLNYPSFWTLISNNDPSYFHILEPMTIVFFMIIIFLLAFTFDQLRINTSDVAFIYIALISTYTCSLFLPCMHERYNYLSIIIGSVLTIIDKKTIPAYLSLFVIETNLYGIIFSNERNIYLLSIFNILTYVYYIVILIHFYKRKECENLL